VCDPGLPNIVKDIVKNSDECQWKLDPSAPVRLHSRRPVAVFGPHRIENIVRPQADPDDLNGLLLACLKRVTPQMPEYTDYGLEEYAEHFFKQFIPVMHDDDIMTFEEFLESMDKPLDFKNQVREYHENRTRDYDIRKNRTTSSFAKDEDYDEIKVLRGIQGISKRSLKGDLNSYYARIIKSMEKVIYDSCPGLVKHMTPEERLQLITQLGTSSFASANDYSSYEASFTVERMEAVQLKLYKHCLGGVSSGDRILKGIREVITGMNRLQFRRTGLSFKCKGRKMSGDPDTALSNAIDNLVCLTYLLSKRGVPPEESTKMLFVEGDDNIGVYGQHTLSQRDFTPLGLKAKPITPSDRKEVDDIGFCQLYGTSGRAICANPWKKLAKVGRAKAKYMGSSDKVFMSLLRAEALSTLHLHAGAPVVSVLATKLLELTRGVNVREKHLKEYEKWGMPTPSNLNWRELSSKEVLMEDRILVESTFDMTVEMQLHIEETIQKWKGGPLNLPTEWFPDLWSYFSDNYVTNSPTQDDVWHESTSDLHERLDWDLTANTHFRNKGMAWRSKKHSGFRT